MASWNWVQQHGSESLIKPPSKPTSRVGDPSKTRNRYGALSTEKDRTHRNESPYRNGVSFAPQGAEKSSSRSASPFEFEPSTHPAPNAKVSFAPTLNDIDGEGARLIDLRAHIEANLQNPIQEEYIDVIKTQFFSLGITSGASLQLFVVCFLLMFASASKDAGPIRELGHEYYPVFRGILLISFFFSMYGTNIFIWRRAKIDYASVLGVSYAHTYQYVLRGASSMAYITFSSFMLYFIAVTGSAEEDLSKEYARHIWPALSFVLPLFIALCPWDSMTVFCFGVKRNGFKQRWGLLKEVLSVLVSPFSQVTFLRSLIADIFCSMPRIFTDLQYTVCIYATGAFIHRSEDDIGPEDPKPHAYYTCGAGNRPYYILQIALGFLPYYIRLCQSVRAYRDTQQSKHIWNGLKYFLALSVTGLAVAHTAAKNGSLVFPTNIPGSSLGALTAFAAGAGVDPVKILEISWIVVGIVTTLYSFYWDVVMDWGLGNFSSRNYLLRDNLSFLPDKYYISIALDFVMRLGWAFAISPEQQYIQQNYMLLLGAVELMRRALWAIFRVEWEFIVKNDEAVSRRTSKILSMSTHKREQGSKVPPVPAAPPPTPATKLTTIKFDDFTSNYTSQKSESVISGD